MEQVLAIIFVTAMWLSTFAYVGKLEQREPFGIRVLSCVAAFYIISFVCVAYFTRNIMILRLVWRAIGMPLSVGFIYVCWKLSFSLSLYYGMWSFMSWQLICELWIGMTGFIQYLGREPILNHAISSTVFFLICYGIIFLTLARWMPEDSKEKLGPRQLILALVIYAVFEVIGYTADPRDFVIGSGRWSIMYLSQLLLAVLLYLQGELFKKSAMREELAIMNTLWKKEQEQYEISKETIALINQKCHDLKHQIRAIRYMEKEEIDAYLEEIEESVQIFESIVKTGNEVLDVILTEKSLYCRENGIIVSCVADGSQMGFINTIDLYAILGNAMDNAIEAVAKFREQEKRQIDVMIYRQQQFLVINIVNPTAEKLVYEEELPRTTKKDRLHHGFGLWSIRYIVKKYDGNLNVSEEDGCFSLKILIPIPEYFR